MNSPLLRGALAVAVLSIFLAPGHLLAWSPKQAPLMTRWAKDVDPDNPLPDYPRPQMVRAAWLNLNGVWELKRGAAGDALPASDAKLPEEILVPFPMESALSGVMDHSERLWYRRHFTVPPAWTGGRVLLHFGAVDWESEVFVNGKSVGVHKGGYVPFSYDVTPFLSGGGPQELVVRVFDPTDDAGEPRGKQSLHPGGIMYTPTTGIWQTVWLEPVDRLYIDSLKIVPDVDGGAVKITVNAIGTTAATAGVTVKAFDPDNVPGGTSASGNANTELRIPVPDAKLWTPDHPFLYGLEVTLSNGREIVDHVSSYFGMRKISVGEVDGVKKMLLNGKFVFEMGPLDQGFWPDGIYTAPTEAALKNDIEMMKAYGFNMVRKHLKVEPARWYYWTDKLGLLVWQDMPSADSYIDRSKHKVPPVDKEEYKTELQDLVRCLDNVPSIIMWDIFNEAQGQHDTAAYVDLVKKMDPSRLVNEASGGGYENAGDVHDIHHYPPPGCPRPEPDRAIACGEYGGVSLTVPGHLWTGHGRAYTTAASPAALAALYDHFAGRLRDFRDHQGLSAAVYTQLTDVETEINGLMTYDRVAKVDPAQLVAANHLEYLPPTDKPVVPTSEEGTPQTWRYTTGKPSDDWKTRDFDDAGWTEGPAAFGKQEALVGHTPWNTSDLWLRRHFNPGRLTGSDLDHLVLKIFHDDDVEVYINGVPAYSHQGYVTSYEYHDLTKEAVRALINGGDNVLAVHCLQKTGGQYIDAGLSEALPLEKQ